MVSATRIVGHLFQVAGMLLMFYGFALQTDLFPSLPRILASTGPSATLEDRVLNLLLWITAGIALIVVGLGIKTYFGMSPGKEKDGESLPLGLLRGRDKP